jgi:TetR/AcrR family transcriptional regulator, tetracycline repressor protein
MPLDRQTILQHAFAQLNASGMESLTLRRLAARLNVQAPALYWHYKNKQELLDEMGTQVLREAVQDGPAMDPEQPWQEWALAYGGALRKTLLRYREGARIFSGTYLTDASLYAALEAGLRKLTGAGFTLRQSVTALAALYNYTIGFVIEEQAVHPFSKEAGPGATQPGQAAEEVRIDKRYNLTQRDERVDKSLYPLAYAAGAELFLNHDARFRAGLEMIVRGIAATRSLDPV